VFNKSSKEIKSWERSLIERTRGQIAWLELQKQHFRRHGQSEKVSTIKRQQRAILMRLDKERAQLRENSERSLIRAGEDNLIDQAVEQLELSMDGNGSDARENIER
jgi:centrosomal protein CEP350